MDFLSKTEHRTRMSRIYSSFVLICVVTQALTDLPEGLCQREIRKYQQVTKISYRPCSTKTRFCPSIQLEYCSYYSRYYKCTYLQYLQVAMVKLTYIYCDGYYFRNGKCEKEVLIITPGTTSTTYNYTRTDDTENAIHSFPTTIEVNKDESTNCTTKTYSDSSETNTTASSSHSAAPEEGNHTKDESKDTSMIVTLLLVAVVVTIAAVIVCCKLRRLRKQKNNSPGETEMPLSRNITGGQDAAHEIEDIELRDESGIYFVQEPQPQDQIADQYINNELSHDADSKGNPYDTVDKRNKYSTEADGSTDGHDTSDDIYDSGIYHHLNRNRKETCELGVYDILPGVDLYED